MRTEIPSRADIGLCWFRSGHGGKPAAQPPCSGPVRIRVLGIRPPARQCHSDEQDSRSAPVSVRLGSRQNPSRDGQDWKWHLKCARSGRALCSSTQNKVATRLVSRAEWQPIRNCASSVRDGQSNCVWMLTAHADQSGLFGCVSPISVSLAVEL